MVVPYNYKKILSTKNFGEAAGGNESYEDHRQAGIVDNNGYVIDMHPPCPYTSPPDE